MTPAILKHLETALISENASVLAIQTAETLEISWETLCENTTLPPGMQT